MTATDMDRPRWALPVLLIAIFMAQFDFFVVNVAAPSIQHGLGAPSTGLQMIVGGYAFAFGSGLILGGRLGDRFGRRRMYLAGTAAFAVASLLCGLASGFHRGNVVSVC